MDYQQRVVEEARELLMKIGALDKFIGSSSVFMGLNTDERARMVKQLNVMKEYHAILVDRIAHFKKTSP